jgi:hypothetical protein
VTRKPKNILAAAAATAIPALALAGCLGGTGSSGASSDSTRTVAVSSKLAPTECGTYNGRGCAPAADRVDLRRPSFSNPTEITNPYFPISRLPSALLLGHVDGKPFRSETTLLPGTKTVAWNGQRIRVRVSQYMAYLDGRLEETAIDRYAQADDGSVWYLGEDVFDYRKGSVGLTEGTWLAGREGPAAMIMPAKPEVGQAFRPENVPGIVFEEVTVKSVDRTFRGPRGPVKGGLIMEELHLDGTREDKLFAPGYGEFRTAGGGDLEALALAAPTDAVPGPPPAELELLSTGAQGILESARVEDPLAVSYTFKRMNAAWTSLRGDKQPPMVTDLMNLAMRALERAVRAQRFAAVAQAAVDVGQPVLDLKLRHRPAAEINAARFELWTQQLRVDAAAKDLAGVTGAVAVLEWMRDRFIHTVGRAGRKEVDSRLRALRIATDAGSLPAAADHAARLGARVRELVPREPRLSL